MKLTTPYYIIYEDRLRRNLDKITEVANQSGAEIIMAFKANALWKTFPIFREYNIHSTASSINEMQLANEELHCKSHTYCPVYTNETIDAFIKGSSHITFNSVKQYLQFKDRIIAYNNSNINDKISCGLRINPMCSIIATDKYNPCCPGSRFGVTIKELSEVPDLIEGFHFHALCESTSYDLEKVLNVVIDKFGTFLPKLKWINMGGGHLMTSKKYDTNHLISLIKQFRQSYPNIKVILEPGSAFCYETGDLESTVVDIVENSNIKTAILDVSFACHMPDCLEMPYKPVISQALDEVDYSKPTYRMGGNSCMSGDYVGDWSFEHELKPGDRITFLDMNHYTTVKTNMFNGIQHPSIVLKHLNGEIEVLREFNYEDYKNRMS
jgi:carboxynorspermidine decarboxylase